jgi:hypothetical protein
MKIKIPQDEEAVNAVMAIMGFLCILFGACCIGLLLAIIKAVLLFFGIENNL